MRRYSTAAALAIALWSLAHILPDALRAIVPIGGYAGYASDADGLVYEVDPASPAAAAGLRPGDRIAITALPIQERRSGIIENGYALRGVTQTIPVERGGKLLRLSLTYAAELPLMAPIAALRVLVGAITIVTALALVILRPGLATWGFFLYAAGANVPSAVADTVVPYPWRLVDDVIDDVLTAASSAGLLLFALRFADSIGRMRRRLEWLVPVLFAVLLFVVFRVDVGVIYLGWPGAEARALDRVIEPLTDAAIIAAFIYAFLRSRGEERERLEWVVVGFTISVGATAIAERLYPETIPYWSYASLQLFGICMPVAVAYAVIRHRVLDLQFALSKAVVYGILTTVVVGIFVVIDNGIGRIVSNSRLTAAAEIAATFVITLTLDRAQKTVDAFVDRVLFRQRHMAEEKIARVARSLPHVDAAETIGQLLIDVPAAAYALRSAALFILQDGEYRRARTFGWPEMVEARLDRRDLIVLELEAEHAPVAIRDTGWSRFAPEVTSVRPVVAMPIAVRRELVAIVVYGAHASGVDLDPDEVRSLDSLMLPAAAAFAHLETLELRKTLDEVQTVRRENELLRTELHDLLTSFERKALT